MRADAALVPSTGHGPFTGLTNMLDKEYGTWWRTRRALIHLALWLAVINGFLFLIGMESRGEAGPFELLEALVEIFFQAGGLFATVGMVVTAQGLVLDERRSGTAEWVLSKPVSRHAFLLAKLLVHALSFLFLAVVIPTVVLFSQSLIHTYLQPAVASFLVGLGLHVQHLLFYLTLTLALGTFFSSRAAVSGVAIGVIFAGLIVPNFAPESLAFGPWGLMGLGATAGTGGSLPDWAGQAITLTALWSVLFVLFALWRFDREEF